MQELSNVVLKEVLLEQMEIEAQMVPPTEDIRKEHTFSTRFLERMREVIKIQERGKQASRKGQVKTGIQMEAVLGEERGETTVFKKLTSRTAKRVMAACASIVILLVAGVVGYQQLNMYGSDSASSEMAMDEASGDVAEETIEMASGDMTEETTDIAEENLEDSNRDGDSGISTETSESEEYYECASMTVDSVTNHSLKLSLVNSTGEELTYGAAYEIEYYDDKTDTWSLLEAASDVVFEEVAFVLLDGEECTLEVDWTYLYGNLTEGTYRIVKEVYSEAERNIYTLTAEFVVE